jgi:anti-sigma B factor antagonist
MRTPSTVRRAGPSGGTSLAASAGSRGPAQVTGPGASQSAGLGVSWRIEGSYAVGVLSGELDIACAAALREQLLGLLRLRSGRLVIDLSAVGYCDASGLSVLVVTGRRAELLGGVLRLAAPPPVIASALRAMGLHRRFDVFGTVQAATAATLPGQVSPSAKAATRRAQIIVSGKRASRAVGAAELRAAVAALLLHADAWRDADPDRRFAPALHALTSAYARTDNALLTEAAGALLAVLAEHALAYTPAVAATASRLRRLLDVG